MATPTYTALATITLSSSASSVTFSSIPSTYRDLVLVVNATQAASKNVQMRINGDSGSNYSDVIAFGYSGGTVSNSASGAQIRLSTSSIGSNWQTTVQIQDYSATDKHKTILQRENTDTTYVKMLAGRWASTSAVTSISLGSYTGDTGDFASGSTFSLYGIEA